MDVVLHRHVHRKRNVAIFLMVIFLIVGAITLLKHPSSPVQKMYQKKPTVETKTTYKNPFNKNTQYVNPFEKYKNPFVTNR